MKDKGPLPSTSITNDIYQRSSLSVSFKYLEKVLKVLVKSLFVVSPFAFIHHFPRDRRDRSFPVWCTFIPVTHVPQRPGSVNLDRVIDGSNSLKASRRAPRLCLAIRSLRRRSLRLWRNTKRPCRITYRSSRSLKRGGRVGSYGILVEMTTRERERDGERTTRCTHWPRWSWAGTSTPRRCTASNFPCPSTFCPIRGRSCLQKIKSRWMCRSERVINNTARVAATTVGFDDNSGKQNDRSVHYYRKR